VDYLSIKEKIKKVLNFTGNCSLKTVYWKTSVSKEKP